MEFSNTMHGKIEMPLMGDLAYLLGKEIDITKYQDIIGSLLYLTANRHDIMFSVCMCVKFQAYTTFNILIKLIY